MLNFTEKEIIRIETEILNRSQESNLGFFSQPFRMTLHSKEFIVKTYIPIKDGALLNQIIENHEPYIEALKASHVTITDTLLLCRPFDSKKRLIIIQEAYDTDTMLRDLVIKADLEKTLALLELILKDTIVYWKNKVSQPIGFHPTLRNYALINGQLEYFDTFPPMLMEQQPLNRIIKTMSPFGNGFKWLVPNKAMNRVSNEYYDYVKMYSGIVGSSCRIHPDRSNEIIAKALETIKGSGLDPVLVSKITSNLKEPPKLSGIWTFIRKISGNEGKPNIK